MDEDDFLIAPETRRRRWLVVAAAVVVFLLLAGGAWAIFGRHPGSSVAQVTPPAIEPAQPTTPTATPDVTVTPAATGTIEPPPESTQTAAPSQAAPSSAPKTYVRAPYVVFRLKGTLYLARETGVRAIPLVTTDGVYALSPDARSLAFVNPASHMLVVLDLTKETTRTIGAARQVAPVWSPDSAWFLAVRDTTSGTQVVRVERSSGAVTVVGAGASAAISPDGSVVALVPSAYAAQRDTLVLLRDGSPWKVLKASGPISGAVLGADRAFVSVSASGGNTASQGIFSLLFVGGGRLLAGSQSADAGALGSLVLSPNTSWLAYALTGDDGYSRMWIVKATGGSPVAVSQRRDYYPLWWASDSSAVFAIEGNSWQGETTALVRIGPDGHKQSVIVSGADR